MKVTYKLTVNPQVKRLSEKFRMSNTQAHKVLKAMDEAVSKEYRKNFASSGSNGGPRWKSLDPKTIKAKKRKGLSTKILIATGAMRDALTGNSSNHQATIRKVNNNVTAFSIGANGTPGRIASYHQAGGPYLPQRNPVQLNDSCVTRITKAVKAVLRESIKKTFSLKGGE